MTEKISIRRAGTIPPWGRALMCAVVMTALSACAGPATRQQSFGGAAAAVDALVAAARADSSDAIVAVLGPDGNDLANSGDPVADKAARDHFVAYYDKAHALQMDGDDKAILVIGDKRWPFPIPVIRRGSAWQFDTAAGRQEILDRRIGRNELNAIKVCRAIVDAQRDFVDRVRASDGVVEYAQKFISSPGLRDGLYWPVEAGETESPIGPLLARARAEGYGEDDGYGAGDPYHGYYYRMLMGQGLNAPDGAYDYLAEGHMIGGFALVAFPAGYGTSGIMTFIVNQDGVVYQKNLGPGTVDAARAMQSFDPDSSWSKVPD